MKNKILMGLLAIPMLLLVSGCNQHTCRAEKTWQETPFVKVLANEAEGHVYRADVWLEVAEGTKLFVKYANKWSAKEPRASYAYLVTPGGGKQDVPLFVHLPLGAPVRVRCYHLMVGKREVSFFRP